MAALRRVQPLQQTDDLAQDVGGYLGIQGGRFQFLVAEQNLDQSDTDRLLQQVGGKGVAQRMHRDALVDAGFVGCGVDGPVELACAEVINRVKAGEQPTTILP